MNDFLDAFISYGRADSKAFASQLCTRLLEQGLKVWFDQNDIPLSVDFQNQIDDGIEKSDNQGISIQRNDSAVTCCSFLNRIFDAAVFPGDYGISRHIDANISCISLSGWQFLIKAR